MKNYLKTFLLMGFFVLFIVPLKAGDDTCSKTRQDLINAVDEAVKFCQEKVSPLTQKTYLWSWRWHHGPCLKKPKKCYTLGSLEKKFTKKNYIETLQQGFNYVGDNEKKMKLSIGNQNGDISKKYCAAISQDVQALVTGCKSIGINLGNTLREIEKLHHDIFGK